MVSGGGNEMTVQPLKHTRAAAAVAAALLAGCASHTGERLVRAPNEDRPEGIFSEEMASAWEEQAAVHYFSERERIPSPVDGVELHAAVMPTGYYPSRLTLEREGSRMKVEFNAAPPVGPPRAPARGTIVAVHGWQTEHRAILPHAMALASAGWDVVLYDQRGHGRSGGEFVTFGAHEQHDLQAIIDFAREREDYTEPLVVLGFSMGASTALLAAAENRPDAIVAVAPFARLDTALPRALRRLAPFYFRPFLSDKRIDRAVAHAQAISGAALADSAPIARAAHIEAPVLLIYSEVDALVPPEHAARLGEALPEARLERIENHSHEALLIDREAILDRTLPWLDEVTDRGR